eukprot:SM010452S14020  [mRNA]  locus=s10452:19:414:- [translate_table: standard]
MGLLAARHAVVQSLLARGPQREDLLRQAVLELAGRDRLDDAAFADFVGCLGRDLAAVECELHAAAHQADGGRLYYGVVNRAADGPTTLGTRLSH